MLEMQPGERIGDYRVTSRLGEGGMSIVYLADHNGQAVALKQLRAELAFDRQLVDRFTQSAKVQRELRHPHLARVIDYMERDGNYFIIEEYLSGGSVADLIARRERYSERDALVWCRDALRAVNYAHENGIVHRDLKPGNLMLDDRSGVKVTDFGIARVFGGPRLTAMGMELGTPTYMSPEQIRSPHHVDHLTDVYSMGVVLYELLTRRVPFDGDSDFTIKSRVVLQPPVRPRQIDARISSAAEALVLRAMAKDPNDRFGGCADFAMHIDRSLNAPNKTRWWVGAENRKQAPPHLPEAGTLPEGFHRERKPPRRHERLRSALVGLTAGSLIGVAATMTPRGVDPWALAFVGAGGAIAGAIIGSKYRLMVVALVGAIVGWVWIGLLTNKFAAGAVLGAPTGAVLGALIGQWLRKRIAWLDFPLSP